MDSEIAETVAKQYAPDFKQPGLERLKRQMKYRENRNLDVSFDQKDADPNLLNQMPNQNSNQTNIRINELPNQIPNKVNKPMGNQIPNQMPVNQNSTQNNPMYSHQPNSYQQQPSYQSQQQQHQQQPYNSTQNSFTLQQQQQQQQHLQNSYQQQNKPYPPTTNSSINNPASGNPYATNNPASNLNDIGTQPVNNNVPNAMGNNIQGVGKNEFNAPLHNPRNSVAGENVANSNSIRRMSRRVSGDRPYLGNIGQQSSIDHFDHYKRPPSRDSSVDR